jgi:alpha-galactosidase
VAERSRPGYWNDPDMMVVGIPWATFTAGHPTMLLSLSMPGTVTLADVSQQPVPAQVVDLVGEQRPDLTEAEQRTHFSLWAMLAAPLLAGNDLPTMTPAARAILTNRDVIAVDQDPLVLQGVPLRSDRRVIAKPLADGSVAVALYNSVEPPVSIKTTATAVGLPPAACYTGSRRAAGEGAALCIGTPARCTSVHARAKLVGVQGLVEGDAVAVAADHLDRAGDRIAAEKQIIQAGQLAGLDGLTVGSADLGARGDVQARLDDAVVSQ